jgi:TATA-box binding protein (TBP) (component of TFIID and TFIIIB)
MSTKQFIKMTAIEDKLSALHSELDEALLGIKTHNRNDIILAPFKITTMTTLFKTNIKSFSIQKFIASYSIEQIEAELKSILPGTWCIKISPRFFNCIIFYYKSPSNFKIAIKLFSNSSLHVTGCKSFDTIFRHINPVLSLFKDTEFSSFNVQMINGTLKLLLPDDQILSLQFLFESIQKDYSEYECIYNKDHHPAVRVKLSKPITVMIFESGSILINAFLNGKQLQEAYNFIMTFFHGNLESLLVVKKKDIKKRKTRDFNYLDYI